MIKEEKLKTYFIEKTPDRYNKKAISVLLEKILSEHKNNFDKNLFLSRINNFKKNSNEKTWLALFAEMSSWNLVYTAIKGKGLTVLFAQNNNNDLCVKANEEHFSIEIKSILPSDFQLDYDNFLKELIRIPSGKAFAIKVNKFSDRKSLFDKITDRIQSSPNKNYICDDFEIIILKEIKNKNKTSLVGPPIGFFVNQNGLINVLEKKLNSKPKQIEQANIICFYSFHTMFDSEDFCYAIETISKQNQIPNINKKKFLCFTLWNSGQLCAIYNNSGTWSLCNADSIFS